MPGTFWNHGKQGDAIFNCIFLRYHSAPNPFTNLEEME